VDPKAPRRQFGSLRVLPSGRHQARYIGPDGRTHKAPVTFETHLDAETYLATVRTDMVRHTWAPPKAKAHTFGKYAERWLEQRKLKPTTYAHYRTILDRFLLPTFGETDLTEITADDVRNWHAVLPTGETYKAHAYGLLRTILRTAMDDGLIKASPCVIRGAGTARTEHETKLPTQAELAKLVEAMPERLRLMVILGTWTALRYGEIAELRRSDIDVKAGVIHVRRGVAWVDGKPIIGPPKSTAGKRDVTIPPHVLPAVKAHLEQHTQWGRDGLLFPNSHDAQLAHTSFYNVWWPARSAAGRPDLRFHDLRHTGATWTAQQGATLAELMARLGHSSPGAAMRYRYAAKDRDRELAAKLSELAEGGQ
jgi:integrase